MYRRQKIAILIFLLVFIFPWLAHLATDWLWFVQTGFENIFATILKAKVLLGLVFGFVAFGLVYLNLKLACVFTRGRPAQFKLG